MEDYSYLSESIEKILDVNCTPVNEGGTSLGRCTRDVVEKFSDDAESKILVVFSDGELYDDSKQEMSRKEELFIEQAVEEVLEVGVTLIMVGVGEEEGAKIPV
jgi:hypothetical protein